MEVYPPNLFLFNNLCNINSYPYPISLHWCIHQYPASKQCSELRAICYSQHKDNCKLLPPSKASNKLSVLKTIASSISTEKSKFSTINQRDEQHMHNCNNLISIPKQDASPEATTKLRVESTINKPPKQSKTGFSPI